MTILKGLSRQDLHCLIGIFDSATDGTFKVMQSSICENFVFKITENTCVLQGYYGIVIEFYSKEECPLECWFVHVA